MAIGWLTEFQSATNQYQQRFRQKNINQLFVVIFICSISIGIGTVLDIIKYQPIAKPCPLAATNTNFMRPSQILIALLIGGLAIWTEFRSVKESALFTDWFDSVPLWTLYILTVVFLIINIRLFISYKQIISLMPLLLCVTSLLIVVWHQKRTEDLDNSPTKFAASTYDIGSDGGFVLDFKANGHLKAEKRDHWAVTYYWGNYSQNHDTVNLDIPLNFKLGRQALLTRDSLHFIGDTIKFIVFRQ